MKDQSKFAFDRGTEITGSKNLLLFPVQHNDELYLVEQTEKHTLTCYNMADSSLHRSSQEINVTKITLDSGYCTMLCFDTKISLLIAKLSDKSWKFKLYYLDTKNKLATPRLISNFSNSIPETMLDFENSISRSHKDGGVIIATAVNDCIYFHTCTISKNTSEKKWASAYSVLSQLQGQPQGRSLQFKMQSSIAVSNNFYCSLLQPGVGGRVCQFNIRMLQQHQKYTIIVRPKFTWHIKNDPTLQNCFVSLHKGEIIIICCSNVDNKCIIEIKQPKPNSTVVSSAQYRFEMPNIVKDQLFLALRVL